MPRDLNAMRDSVLSSMAELHKSPDTIDPPKSSAGSEAASSLIEKPTAKTYRGADKQDSRGKIKPYSQSLTLSNVDSCLALEEATFPSHERCTKEKFIYRFSKCGELSLGLFTSVNISDESSSLSSAPTVSAANPVYSGAPDRKCVLLAHCVATKTNNATVHDEDMAVPQNWEKKGSTTASSEYQVGHRDNGRTICIHSLAVLPQCQGQGLGSLLLKAYLQRLDSSGVADRVALLAHESLIGFYERLGFQNKGPSQATFGGEKWFDMVHELK